MSGDDRSSRLWDYVVFGSLTILSLGTGLYLSLRKRSGFGSKDETFLGSRTIRTFPLALSMCASNVTASGLIAFTAHYYLYGFHTLWAIPAFVPAVLIVAFLFLPVLYELKVTSIFEYLRMRYGNGVGIASSVIYFMLSGGLRSVVWADCVQALIMSAAPLIIIFKVIYDSSQSVSSLRSLDDFDVKAYFFRTVSSIVNSHAAVLFVDIVSPNFRVSEKKSALVVAALDLLSGERDTYADTLTVCHYRRAASLLSLGSTTNRMAGLFLQKL
ncbi:hypothetical protein V5799_022101 [Amblyomma americanum]|uniref:Sodium-dependent multivitamin transporter n=1 Tax=Amblyomma americanum TaxID=6943 RepID=A0AAQ4FLZ5_AMBAM